VIGAKDRAMNGMSDFAIGRKARRDRIEAYLLCGILAVSPLLFLVASFFEYVVKN